MPFGVIRLSDDVEMYATRKHVVDEEDGFVALTTERDVKHHYHIWIDGLHCGSSRIDQLREIVKIAHVSIGPDNSMIDLISNLHHVGSCALLLEFHHHHVGVIIQRLLEFFERKSFPCFGLELFSGIGPCVAVMKVEEKFHACILHTLRHFLRMLKIAETLTG